MIVYRMEGFLTYRRLDRHSSVVSSDIHLSIKVWANTAAMSSAVPYGLKRWLMRAGLWRLLMLACHRPCHINSVVLKSKQIFCYDMNDQGDREPVIEVLFGLKLRSSGWKDTKQWNVQSRAETDMQNILYPIGDSGLGSRWSTACQTSSSEIVRTHSLFSW